MIPTHASTALATLYARLTDRGNNVNLKMEKNMKTSILLVSLLLSISYTAQVQTQGCLYESKYDGWTCDFKRWRPPLKDESFAVQPYRQLKVDKINGVIPAEAFSGLNGPHADNSKTTFMHLYCVTGGRTTLARNIFTQNLHWIEYLYIFECYLENGLPSRLLENLKSLHYLEIQGGGIDTVVLHDSLAGLTNLRHIKIYSPVRTGRLPSGFFDGLKNLSYIDLQSSELNVIPPNLFQGLTSVYQIFLSYNNLQTLPPGLFNGLPSLKYVWLHNNQWNCSCGLKWLLDWSHVTVGGVCENPLAMHGKELDDAFRQFDCTTSTLTSLSVAHLDTKKTETGTSPADTTKVAAVPVADTSVSARNSKTTITSAFGFALSSITTPLQKDWIPSTFPSTFVEHMASTRCMTITTIPTPTTSSNLSATTITAVIKRTPTAVWTTSKTRTQTTLLKLLSIPSVRSTVARAAVSASVTSKETVSYKWETSYVEAGNDLHKIIFISTICAALTVLVLVTVVLYQCIYCHMNTGRLIQVNSGEEDRHRATIGSRNRLRRPTNERTMGVIDEYYRARPEIALEWRAFLSQSEIF